MSKRERFKLSLSVFMLLLDKNKILIIKRGNTGWMDGFYSIPAGAIDGAETIEDAAIRETKEEVNVTVNPKNIKLAHIMHNLTEDEEWIGAFFVTTKWKGEPIVNEPHKHTEVKWIDINKLPKNTIPYVKQAIKAFINNEHYSEYGWRNK